MPYEIKGPEWVSPDDLAKMRKVLRAARELVRLDKLADAARDEGDSLRWELIAVAVGKQLLVITQAVEEAKDVSA